MSAATPAPHHARDVCFMGAAIALAQGALGTTAPNPSVGAIVVSDDHIRGRGVTQPGGRPHAEAVAIAQAGSGAKGATLYVTLEPCAKRSSTHFGPSCTDVILGSGIARVVVACEDPTSFAAGGAFPRLRAAGIEIVVGVLRKQACRLVLGHLRRTLSQRPSITLKLARTRDGFAAGVEGAPRAMITGEPAGRLVQWMRASHDAVMVGAGTVRHDDPRLTVRLDLLPERRPVRIVIDTDLSLSPLSRLARSAGSSPIWVIGAPDASTERQAALEDTGVIVWAVPRGGDGRLDLHTALGLLAERGLTRVFCEGGPTLASALMAIDVLDTVAVFTGPSLLRHGLSFLSREAKALLEDGTRYRRTMAKWVGIDHLECFERQAPCSLV